MGLKERAKVAKDAKLRMKKIKFGDPVTNVCAGESNPSRHGYFVKVKKVQNSTAAECTDKKGRFWSPDIKVIFPGHLDYEECERLYDPIWEAFFK